MMIFERDSVPAMAHTKLRAAAINLPDEERAELAAVLTDSLGCGDSSEDVQASWVAESQRRLATHESDSSSPVTFAEMMQRLRHKYA